MAMAVFPKRQTLQIFRVPISQLVKGLFIEILVWLPDYEQIEEACSCTRKSFDVTEQLNFSQHLTAIVPENESLVFIFFVRAGIRTHDRQLLCCEPARKSSASASVSKKFPSSNENFRHGNVNKQIIKKSTFMSKSIFFC